MPSIKIYPPSKLPDRKLTETQFSIWREELEVYLSQEKTFLMFLPGQSYSTWESAEAFDMRIRQLHQQDMVRIDRDIDAAEAALQNEKKTCRNENKLKNSISYSR